MSTQDAIINSNATAPAQGPPAWDSSTFELSKPQARIFLTKPDEAHLAMLRNKLLNDGVVHLPIHVFEGSYDKRHSAPNHADDVSTSGSLLVKTYVTWVNRATSLVAAQSFLGGYELEDVNTNGVFKFARFCPRINSLRISVSG